MKSSQFLNTFAFIFALFLLGITGASAATTRNVSLSWDASPEDVAGYRVYYGKTPGVYTDTVDVGPNNAVTLSGLGVAQAYYFVVTVYDAANIESNPSAEASVPAAAAVVVSSGSSGGTHNQNGSVTLKAKVHGLDPFSMRVTFFADDQKIGESTSEDSQVTWTANVAGTHTVRAVAQDSTGTSVQSTDVVLNVVRFAIQNIEPLPDGGVRLTITGAPHNRNRVYYSDNLSDWTLLTTVDDTDATWWLEDPTGSPSGQRYYRVEADTL